MVEDGKTVLVTGGSGYLGGWCIVELLRRGYRVRTTVRNPTREREVHEAVASEIDPAHRLTVHQADLLGDEHWDNIIEGCDYVLHVASPFPQAAQGPGRAIRPAREGTIRVLGKSLDHDVKRVVVTSSIAAIRLTKGAEARTLTEEDWTDPDSAELTPYVRSKTVAERAAWDLVQERGAEDRLAVVNPGAIIGPVLHDDILLLGPIRRAPAEGPTGRAEAGVRLRRCTGRRRSRDQGDDYPRGRRPAVHRRHQVPMDVETGEILRERLGDQASKVPTRTIPDLLVRGMALFDGGIRSIVGTLGKRTDLSSSGRWGWAGPRDRLTTRSRRPARA